MFTESIGKTFAELKPLIQETYDYAKEKYAKKKI